MTAQQWLWTFNYPQYGVSSQGQVLELPVNRPVEFDVTSEDVLHGFAIQAFGIRVDANPGEVTSHATRDTNTDWELRRALRGIVRALPFLYVVICAGGQYFDI